jgi:hydroxymethylpyrimidine pyrophosphatase-like HAD family hydrolase
LSLLPFSQRQQLSSKAILQKRGGIFDQLLSYKRQLDDHRATIVPATNWIVCDVGTPIYQRTVTNGFELVEDYATHRERIVESMGHTELKRRLVGTDGLRIQEPEKLGRFKLSYYADRDQLADLVSKIQQQLKEWNASWSIIASVDPFIGDGLIDLLPKEVSKAHALSWWTSFRESKVESIVLAGDSGNDLAALTAGYKSIVVANAADEIAAAVKRTHESFGRQDRLFLATEFATSGVLEGCKRYWE